MSDHDWYKKNSWVMSVLIESLLEVEVMSEHSGFRVQLNANAVRVHLQGRGNK